MSKTQLKSPTVLLDVDNVIYDNEASDRYVRELLDTNYGPGANKDFDSVYQEVKKELGLVDWKEIAIRFAAKRSSDDYASVLAIFLEIPFKDYFRPNAIDLLDFLKVNSKLIILSDGDNLYQKTKIEKLELHNWSEEIIITKSKIGLFGQLDEKYGSELILIDDKPEVIAEAKRVLKGKIIWVKYGHHAEKVETTEADLETEDLNEVQRYLETTGHLLA